MCKLIFVLSYISIFQDVRRTLTQISQPEVLIDRVYVIYSVPTHSYIQLLPIQMYNILQSMCGVARSGLETV